MAEVPSSCDGVAISYVLPVLRMTSRFRTMGPTAEIKLDAAFRRSLAGGGTELYIYLETIRPIRTAENFEAVEWATGFSNENGCIEACLSSPTRT